MSEKPTANDSRDRLLVPKWVMPHCFEQALLFSFLVMSVIDAKKV